MSRYITIAAAQLGPIEKDHSRESVVERLIAMLHQAVSSKSKLVVFPELALTTFFPRWYTEDLAGHDHYYETSMPSPATQAAVR